MTYEAREESRTLGEPVNLFLFKYGEGSEDLYAYTDAEEDITISPITYKAVVIAAGVRKSSGSLDKATFNVDCPTNLEIAQLFLGYPPSFVVTLTMREVHIGDPDLDAKVVWAGRVLSGSHDNSECTLNCEPVSTSMRRPGLRRQYQIGCPHALYGPQCSANKLAATSTHVPLVIGTGSLTFPNDWVADVLAPKFLGGIVQWDTPAGVQIRTVLQVSPDGRTLRLSGPIVDLELGQQVTTILGCNHQMTDCANIHDNINNYGGQPWIPTKNPIGTNANLYY